MWLDMLWEAVSFNITRDQLGEQRSYMDAPSQPLQAPLD